MSNSTNSIKRGLTVKDLVTTGIFTALVFVFVLVGGLFFAPNPVLTFFMPAGSGLLAGPVFLLMIAKVQKRWSLSIMGVVIGIIWFVMLIFRHMVYRGSGNAGGLGPGADDRERLGGE